MPKQALKVIIIFLISCLYSCSDNDIPRILNKAPKDNSFNISLKKSFTLEDHLGKIMYGQVAVSRERIFIFDSSNSIITSYDHKGKVVNKFGGKGNGPGEISFSGGIIFCNDTLYVFDNSQKKTHLFSEEGEYFYSKLYDYGFYVSRPDVFDDGIMLLGMISEADRNFKILNVFLNRNLELVRTDTMIAKQFNSAVDTYTDFNVLTASNGKNYYIANNSDHKYQIDEFDKNHNKIREIHKTHRRVSLNDLDKEHFAKSNRGVVPRNAIYHKAINKIWNDKFNRLWVLSGNDLNTSDSLLYFDIFKEGQYLNTVKFDFLKNMKSKLMIEDYFTIKGNYIFVFDEDIDNYVVYSY